VGSMDVSIVGGWDTEAVIAAIKGLVATGSLLAAFIVAHAANIRGRSGIGWFFYALLFWPLALINLLIIPPRQDVVDRYLIEAGERRRCPHCLELVKPAATVCRYCGSTLAAPPISS